MHPLRSFGMLWPLRMIRPLHPLDFLYLLYAVLMEISDTGAAVEFNSSPYIYRCSRGQLTTVMWMFRALGAFVAFRTIITL